MPTALPVISDAEEPELDGSETEIDLGQVVLRPDGYHWQTADGKREFGPFESMELALADMLSASEDAPEEGESLQEAEDELGLADWVDPETGCLAEGHCTPHLVDD
ncbi:hypothetical protein RQP54_14780 [Curvibacter sp. APW13]|uniref:hypothetical protein n=1 Tax=Curvibacter sp. APW13 TaxID=3077236 RepID=UPI0028DF721F|nr:hypothetical protein [Curvibacter sp. APW13]MDT8992136.1 hypothetical protein [Curvibacter sp. APW13]